MTIKLIFPEATTNLCTNPSVELDTTGYSSVNGATVARSTNRQSRGADGLTIDGANVNAGADYTRTTLVNGAQYTVSFDFYGVSAIPYTFEIRDGSGAVTSLSYTGEGRWTRQSLTGVLGSGTTLVIRWRKNNSADANAFWVDGVQIENKAYATTYIDGDQPGGVWVGLPHGSSSTRDSRDKRGGREKDVVTDLGYSAVLDPLQGFGMPPLEYLVERQALLDGSSVQDVKILERPMSIGLNLETTSVASYASLRKPLVEAFSPFKGLTRSQSTRLIFDPLTTDLEIDVDYVSGLQGPYGATEVYTKQPKLDLVARDPFWRERFDVGTALNSKSSVPVKLWAGYRDGDWSYVTQPSSVPAVGELVWDVAVGQDGKVYIGGSFLNWDGIAAADNFVIYDPSSGAYSAAGSGLNGVVRQILPLANGSILVVGDFTASGGTTLRRWALWDGSAWSEPFGWGFNGAVYSVALAANGTYYLTGGFTEVGTGSGAPTAATRAASVTSSGTRSALGTGLNDIGEKIAIHPDGKVYFCGQFTSAGGVASTNLIAYWSGSAWMSVGGGVITGGGGVAQRGLAISTAGLVYFGGNFSVIGSGNLAVSNIAVWNGTAWSALAGGVNNTVFDIHVYTEDRVFIVGNFITADSQSLIGTGITAWNGTSFDLAAGAGFPSALITVQCIMPTGANSYYVGLSDDTTVTSIGKTSLSYTGTADVRPRAKIKRSGGTSATLKMIRNATTGVALDFNYAMADGETVDIDFDAGTITSSINGSIIDEMITGVGLGAFTLIPGDNIINLFVEETGSPTITAVMWWRPRHLSVDGVG
jgi:hypothetical protein